MWYDGCSWGESLSGQQASRPTGEQANRTYSERSAVVGSTRVARRAGMTAAASRPRAIASAAEDERRRLERRHFEQQALGHPGQRGRAGQAPDQPDPDVTITCRTTIASTLGRRAPSAMRMPISRRRWVTVCATTP